MPDQQTTPLFDQPDKDRLEALKAFELDPGSLVGSWFHRTTEHDGILWQGQIVAEPQPGKYLLHITSAADRPSGAQVILPLEAMTWHPEATDEWTFYDTEQKASNAYAEWYASAGTVAR